MLCGSGYAKVSSLNQRVRSHLVSRGIKITRHFDAKRIQKPKCTKHFGVGLLSEVEMLENAYGHVAKRMWKLKGTKHNSFKAIWDLEVFKRCMQFWPEADVEVKSAQIYRFRTTFGQEAVEKSAAVCGAKHTSSEKR